MKRKPKASKKPQTPCFKTFAQIIQQLVRERRELITSRLKSLRPVTFLPISYRIVWVSSRIHLPLCHHYTFIPDSCSGSSLVAYIGLYSTDNVALGMKQGGWVPSFSQGGKKKIFILIGFIKGLVLSKALSNLNKFKDTVWRHRCVTINYLWSSTRTGEVPEVPKVDRFVMISHYLITVN